MRGAQRWPMRAATSKDWNSCWRARWKNGDCNDDHRNRTQSKLNVYRRRRAGRRRSSQRPTAPRSRVCSARSACASNAGRPKRTSRRDADSGGGARGLCEFGEARAGRRRLRHRRRAAARERHAEHRADAREVSRRTRAHRRRSAVLRRRLRRVLLAPARQSVSSDLRARRLDQRSGRNAALVRHGTRSGIHRHPLVQQSRGLGAAVQRHRDRGALSRNTSDRHAARSSPISKGRRRPSAS